MRAMSTIQLTLSDSSIRLVKVQLTSRSSMTSYQITLEDMALNSQRMTWLYSCSDLISMRDKR